MPTPEQLARLAAVVPYAQQTQRRWHIRASVTLAQWTFESGWGKDGIAVLANNHFGIKHLQSNRNEPYMEFRTQEYAKGASQPHYETAQFVRYDSVQASFEAHGKFLCGTRYVEALSYADDPYAYARALQRAGYSTDPKYAAKLCAQIDALNLTQYDQLPPDPLAGRKIA